MQRKSLLNSLRITAILILVIVGLNALAAGYSFIADPSGKGLNLTTAYLKETAPFKNYLVPGVVLFVLNGVLPITIALLALARQNRYSLLILLQGLILVAWIFFQLMMVTAFHPLHAVIGCAGLLLMIIGRILEKI